MAALRNWGWAGRSDWTSNRSRADGGDTWNVLKSRGSSENILLGIAFIRAHSYNCMHCFTQAA